MSCTLCLCAVAAVPTRHSEGLCEDSSVPVGRMRAQFTPTEHQVLGLSISQLCASGRERPQENCINTEPSEKSDAEGGARTAEDAAALRAASLCKLSRHCWLLLYIFS